MRRTFKYRAKINKTTEQSALNWLYLCRTLYNMALEQRIDAYKKQGKTLSAYDQNYELPELKKLFPEFKIVNAQCLQDVTDRLDKAYQNFFRRIKSNKGKAGFPRFKGKNRYDSFTLKQSNWKLNGRNLCIRNVGRFKLFFHRPVGGIIKTVTIKRASTGKWFVTFSCDNVPARGYPPADASVGIDIGSKTFLVDSDGEKVNNPKYLKQAQRELRIKQRTLMRRKKGSNRRNKARIQVAKAHEKVTNQRLDFLHKLANSYINKYGTIFIEDLNISQMTRNIKGDSKYIGKSIADAGWGIFFNLLSYKAEEAGRTIVKVPSKGTTEICSDCGEQVPKSLKVRVHRCPHCRLVLGRDLNAAINVLRFGQNLQAQTSAVAGVA